MWEVHYVKNFGMIRRGAYMYNGPLLMALKSTGAIRISRFVRMVLSEVQVKPQIVMCGRPMYGSHFAIFVIHSQKYVNPQNAAAVAILLEFRLTLMQQHYAPQRFRLTLLQQQSPPAIQVDLHFALSHYVFFLNMHSHECIKHTSTMWHMRP